MIVYDLNPDVARAALLHGNGDLVIHAADSPLWMQIKKKHIKAAN
jgi:hypothetical protein